jgi:hypothetical protein
MENFKREKISNDKRLLNTVKYEQMSILQSKYVTALKMAVDQKKPES